MVCDTHNSFRRFQKCDLLSSQNDSLFTNLRIEEDIELTLSSLSSHKFVTLIPINPQLAFINWYIDETTASNLKNDIGAFYEHSCLILRIYDVTGVDFNGYNARNQFDIEIEKLSGCHYQQIDLIGCLLLAEVGFRCSDWRFFPCARSNTMFFRGPVDFSSGLYISHGFNRFYTINQNADPPSTRKTLADSSLVQDNNRFSVAIFLNEQAVFQNHQEDKKLFSNLRVVLDQVQKSKILAYLFTSGHSACETNQSRSIVDLAFETSMHLLDKFYQIHSKNPFHCVQSHNWYSTPAAMIAASASNLPFISVCHSLELERKSQLPLTQSQLIESWERKSILKADMVLVSKESTRKLVIDHYGKPEEKVAFVDDFCEYSPFPQKEYKGLPFNLSQDQPILLFAGELTYNSGIDLIIESLPNVCREFPQVSFVFAGDGEFRAALEKRASVLGVSKNCFFTGHLDTYQFDQLFEASYALLLPLRHRCDNQLARRAIEAGLTLLTTHQAAVEGIKHGYNGLVVFDNPGSVCWGIKEILSRSRKNRNCMKNNSIKNIATIYSTIWTNLLLAGKEVQN
jgi:glycosyltransferase involved in cell wall biosynthesis